MTDARVQHQPPPPPRQQPRQQPEPEPEQMEALEMPTTRAAKRTTPHELFVHAVEYDLLEPLRRDARISPSVLDQVAPLHTATSPRTHTPALTFSLNHPSRSPLHPHPTPFTLSPSFTLTRSRRSSWRCQPRSKPGSYSLPSGTRGRARRLAVPTRALPLSPVPASLTRPRRPKSCATSSLLAAS